MKEMKITYEQFCTHLGKNITMEKITHQDGKITVNCTNCACFEDGGCKNKLAKNK